MLEVRKSESALRGAGGGRVPGTPLGGLLSVTGREAKALDGVSSNRRTGERARAVSAMRKVLLPYARMRLLARTFR